MPIVSVIIPSYNHEKYVAECIQSVLDQTFSDFEIIIIDDGSQDNTVKIIEGFTDERIKLIKHAKNQGACIATNNCLKNSTGKYIALIGSDDVWYPEKLQVEVEYLESHPNIGAVFTKADFIDESSKAIRSKLLPGSSMFDVNNKNRFEWLRYFFLKGNCLCHPSSMVRKECYFEVGMFNPAYASLPDLDFWIRLCLKYEIWIIDQKLIKFRRFASQTNASGYRPETLIRNNFEYTLLLSNYLNITNVDDLLKIFPEASIYGKPAPEIVPYFLGRIAIGTSESHKILWGLVAIKNLMENTEVLEALENNCNFTYTDFTKLTGQYVVFKMEKHKFGHFLNRFRLLMYKLFRKY